MRADGWARSEDGVWAWGCVKLNPTNSQAKRHETKPVYQGMTELKPLQMADQVCPKRGAPETSGQGPRKNTDQISCLEVHGQSVGQEPIPGIE